MKMRPVWMWSIFRPRTPFWPGQFASYHVYPYYPDYLEAMLEAEQYTEAEITERLERSTLSRVIAYRLSHDECPAH